MPLKSILAITAIFLFAGCAATGSQQRIASPEDPFAMPIPEFMHEQAVLRANLKEGYPRELDEEEWERLDRFQTDIIKLVGDATEIEQIGMDDRYKLFELRTRMVHMLVGDVEPGVVCFRQHTTGTRLAGNQRCYTMAQLESRRFEADTLMRYIESIPEGAHDPMAGN